jgi:hypothetical protein
MQAQVQSVFRRIVRPYEQRLETANDIRREEE